ncbi:hypothetical protein AWC38_SpisGene14899 [Stylophora pistillata]|uniref:Uncharacterized protein n=1 Tax=Stylophora pistillata TaxID=50429 RepID=A0A2B4RSR1_STYPI|nr:hypothetical protein AWC38_SpisGene14899 [Stylophora pistillata]
MRLAITNWNLQLPVVRLYIKLVGDGHRQIYRGCISIALHVTHDIQASLCDDSHILAYLLSCRICAFVLALCPTLDTYVTCLCPSGDVRPYGPTGLLFLLGLGENRACGDNRLGTNEVNPTWPRLVLVKWNGNKIGPRQGITQSGKFFCEDTWNKTARRAKRKRLNGRRFLPTS